MNTRILSRGRSALLLAIAMLALSACGGGEAGKGDAPKNASQCCENCQAKPIAEMDNPQWLQLKLPFGKDDILCKQGDQDLIVLAKGIQTPAELRSHINGYSDAMIAMGYMPAGPVNGVTAVPFDEKKDYLTGKEVVALHFHTGPILYSLEFRFQNSAQGIVHTKVRLNSNAQYMPPPEQLRSFYTVNILFATELLKGLEATKNELCHPSLLDAIPPADKILFADEAELKAISALDPEDRVNVDSDDKGGILPDVVLRHNKITSSVAYKIFFRIHKRKDAKFSDAGKFEPGMEEGMLLLHNSATGEVLCAMSYSATSNPDMSGGNNAIAEADLTERIHQAQMPIITRMVGTREIVDMRGK